MSITRIRQVIDCSSDAQQTYDISFSGTPFHVELHFDDVGYSGAGDAISCRLSADDNATEYDQTTDYYRGATYSSGNISAAADYIFGIRGNTFSQCRAQLWGLGYAVKTLGTVLGDDGTTNQPRGTIIKREAATVENALRLYTFGGSQTMNAGRIIITAYYSDTVTVIDLSDGTPSTTHLLSGGLANTAWLSIHGANNGDSVTAQVTSSGTPITTSTYRETALNSNLADTVDGQSNFQLLESSPSGTDDKCAAHTVMGLNAAVPTMTHGISMNEANGTPVSLFGGIHETATAYDGLQITFASSAPDAGHILWVPS